MESQDNKFNFVNDLFQLKKSWTPSFTKTRLHEEYCQLQFSKSRGLFISIVIMMIVITISQTVRIFTTIPYETYPNYLLLIKNAYLFVTYCSLLLISIFSKKWRTIFKMQIILISHVYLNNLIIIIYSLIFKVEYSILLRNIFFFVISVYFFSIIFFEFSIVKIISINIIMIIPLTTIYVLIGRNDISGEITYICFIVIFFELWGYYFDLNSKKFFIKNKQIEYMSHYFMNLLTEMKPGVAIIKQDEFIFNNQSFNDFLADFPETLENENKANKFFDFIDTQIKNRKHSASGINVVGISADKNKNKEDIFKTNNNKTLDTDTYSHPKMKFEKIGPIFSKTNKIYEIFVSQHEICEINISEIVVNDMTDTLERAHIEKEFKIKSRIVAKMSHEFTSILITIDKVLKNTKLIIKQLYESSKKFNIQNNLYKIKLLSKYLLSLTRELSSYISFDDEKVEKLFSVINLNKLCKKSEKIIEQVESLYEGANTLDLNYSVKTVTGRTMTLDDITLKVKSDKDSLYHFTINLFHILFKVFAGKAIDVAFVMYQRSVKKTFKAAELYLVINISVPRSEIVRSIAASNQKSLINTNQQGIETIYNLCKNISDELNLNFKIQTNNFTNISYELPIYDVDFANSVCSGSSIATRKLSHMSLHKLPIDQNLESKLFEPHEIQSHDNSPIHFKRQAVHKEDIKKSAASLINVEKESIKSTFKFSPSKLIVKKAVEWINFIDCKATSTDYDDAAIVIIADDMVDIRDCLKNMVSSIFKSSNKNVQIIECVDGVDVLYRIFRLAFTKRINKLSCLITDQYMSFMNGSKSKEILNEWISDRKIFDFPTIFCTAFQDEINISNISQTNPSKILSKPVKKITLQNVLEELNVINN